MSFPKIGRKGVVIIVAAVVLLIALQIALSRVESERHVAYQSDRCQIYVECIVGGKTGFSTKPEKELWTLYPMDGGDIMLGRGISLGRSKSEAISFMSALVDSANSVHSGSFECENGIEYSVMRVEYDSCSVTFYDVSPGWEPSLMTSLKVGEFLSMREAADVYDVMPLSKIKSLRSYLFLVPFLGFCAAIFIYEVVSLIKWIISFFS